MNHQNTSGSAAACRDGTLGVGDVKELTSDNNNKNTTSDEVNKEEVHKGVASDTADRNKVPANKQIEAEEDWVLATASASWTIVASFEDEE